MTDVHAPRLSLVHSGLPSSPVNSGTSSPGVTRFSRYGSISTMATSNVVDGSEAWYDDEKRQQAEVEAESASFDVDFRLPVSQRPKGRYSLTDFTLMRTVGTGSFGRVHLGAYIVQLLMACA